LLQHLVVHAAVWILLDSVPMLPRSLQMPSGSFECTFGHWNLCLHVQKPDKTAERQAP